MCVRGEATEVYLSVGVGRGEERRVGAGKGTAKDTKTPLDPFRSHAPSAVEKI